MTDCTAKVIASSITEHGQRIDTLQLRYPRIIHAEVLTHRVKSRNASSTRAIPVASMLARDEMFIPKFAKNKPGMQAGKSLSREAQWSAEHIWKTAAEACRKASADLAALGVHKQWSGRPLEWFSYIDVVMTATTWSNFDALRDHEAAQPEAKELSRVMQEARDAVTPTLLDPNDWHLPYITEEDRGLVNHLLVEGHSLDPLLSQLLFAFVHPGLFECDLATQFLIAMSAARCCRVSYAKHDGTTPAIQDDVDRFCGLAQADPKHASPLEHQARPLKVFDDPFLQGNFQGFAQFRKFIPNESL